MLYTAYPVAVWEKVQNGSVPRKVSGVTVTLAVAVIGRGVGVIGVVGVIGGVSVQAESTSRLKMSNVIWLNLIIKR
jgi:hypothetical protein